MRTAILEGTKHCGIAYRVVPEAFAAHGAEIDELGTDLVD